MTAFTEMQPQRKPVRNRKRRLLFAGIATAAAASAVAVGLGQTQGQPAYALNPNADGSITFVVNDTSDPEGATRALQKAGVHAVVMPAHKPGTCPAAERGVRDGRVYPTLLDAVMSEEYRKAHPEASSHTLLIRPDRIPDGTVLVIGTYTVRFPDRERVIIHPELFRAPGPTCHEAPVDK